jgi:hypothetical protein
VFRDRIFSKDIWPPQSPDLAPPGEAMKGTVYGDNPHILLETKEAIINFIRNILLTELSCASASKIRHVDVCLQAGRSHFQHLLALKYEKCICNNIQGLLAHSVCATLEGS